jgi:hypothetical protein
MASTLRARIASSLGDLEKSADTQKRTQAN